jgi:endonuclease/exonuclease/phosphatase family metal-dependent hydrolase
VLVKGKTIHILAMHPTPPAFDGAEDRNGKRNHDEIRLMADYLSPNEGAYIYDDNNEKVSLEADANFVLVGDFNAADVGDKYRVGVIEQLLNHRLYLVSLCLKAREVLNRSIVNTATALQQVGGLG